MRAKTLAAISLVLAFVPSLARPILAQQAPPDERFYQAIRNDDLVTLRALVAERGPNARGTSGLNPLMMAAAFGSPAAAKLLLDAGANVNAAGAADLTPLHLAISDENIVRLLIAKGADVQAKSIRRRTPLIMAAAANGTTAVVQLLLEKGADVNAADEGGNTPLIAAAGTGNVEVARLLLDRGANPHARSQDGQVASALMGAAVHGDLELTKLLLARKPDLSVASPPGLNTVKNGIVAFGQVTALHLAVVSRTPDLVTALLDAGAPLDLPDMRGMTPLMFAVASDHADPRIVRLLLARGASLTVKDNGNETAVDWARKYNNPDVLTLVKLKPVTPVVRSAAVVAAPAGAAHTSRTAREAVERSLPLLNLGSSRMMSDGGCVACHAQPMTSLATQLAANRGWRPEPATEAMTQMTQHVTGVMQGMLQLAVGGGAPDAQLYDALAMHTAGIPAVAATDALVFYLASTQDAAGVWQRPTPNRGPIQDGDMSRTAMAIQAMAAYGPKARKADLDRRIARAANWLAKQDPACTEDRVMQLLGLSWAGRPPSVQDERVKKLMAMQRPDGGWAQTPYLGSDAYATGQVLYTLSELGVQRSNASVARGIAFLLGSQREDGTWYVTTRAMPIQPYFQSGFPYEHDQWISQSGTAWAAMALAATAEAEPPAASAKVAP